MATADVGHPDAVGPADDRRDSRRARPPREDADDRQIQIDIEHTSGDIASVTCLCHLYVDLLHLVREGDEWRLVNAAWRER